MQKIIAMTKCFTSTFFHKFCLTLIANFLSFLLISIPTQVNGSPQCLIFRGNSCLECGSDFYNPNIHASLNFSSEDCVRKTSKAYEKKIYVSASNHFEQSFQANYSDLWAALAEEEKISLPYFYGNLEFILIGTPHFIYPPTLSTSFFELFKRSNMNVTLRGMMEEECAYLNLTMCYQYIEIILKAQKFIFFVSNHLMLKNIIIEGSDIYNPNCGKETRCCSDDDLNKAEAESPCGLKNRMIRAKTAEQLQKIPALFTVLNIEDADEITSEPFLEMENVEFRNIYSLLNESSWQALVKSSELLTKIQMKKVNYTNNFLPLGLFKQMKFEEDPYYSSYKPRSFQINKYLNQSVGDNRFSLIIEDVCIKGHENIMINYVVDTSQRYPEYTFFEIKGSYYRLSINNLNIVNSRLSKNYYLLKISNNTIKSPGSLASNISIINCSGLGFIKSIFTNWDFNFLYFRNISLTNGSLLNLKNSLMISLRQIQIQYYYASKSAYRVVEAVQVNQVFFEKYLIGDSESLYFYFEGISDLWMDTLNFFNIINKYFTTGPFYLKSIENVTILSTSLSKFSALQEIIQAKSLGKFTLLGSNFTVMRYYYFLYWDGLPRYGNILFNDINFFNILGPKANTSSLSTLLLLMNYNSSIIRNMNFRNSLNGILMQNRYASLLTLIDNCNFESVEDLDYYFIICYMLVKTPENNSFMVNHTNMRNIISNRDLLLNFFSSWGKISFINCVFYNLSYNEALSPTNSDKTLFHIQLSESSLFENCTVIYVTDNFLNIIIKHHKVPLVNISNCLIKSIYKSIRRSGTVYTYRSNSFTLKNNVFENLEFNVDPLSSSDGIGIVYGLGGDSTAFDYSSVIINNTFKNLICKTLNGILAFYYYQNLTINNNQFIGCLAKIGGGITIRYSSISTLFNNTFTNCSANEGGSIYLRTIKMITMLNLEFTNSKAMLNGGGFYIDSVSYLMIKGIVANASFAFNRGGFLILYNCFSCKIEEIFLEDSQSAIGGVFFFEESNIMLYNLWSKVSSAQTGGFCVISTVQSNVTIDKAIIINSSSQLDGGVIYSTNVKMLKIQNMQTQYCESIDGFGVISLNDYASKLNSDDVGTFELLNITCYKNKAKIGSCLSMKSNNRLKIIGLVIQENLGSLITIKSDSSSDFYVSHMSIIANNKDFINKNTNRITPTFTITEAGITFHNSSFIETYLIENLFKVQNIKVTFDSCLFQDFSPPNYEMKGSLNFGAMDLELCSLVINNSFFVNVKNISLESFHFSYIVTKNSNVQLINTVFQSCITRGSQPFFFGLSVITITQCLFTNNMGILAGTLKFSSCEATIILSVFHYNFNRVEAADNLLISEASVDIFVDGLDYSSNSILKILSCLFSTYRGLSTIIRNIKSVEISNSSFNNNFSPSQALRISSVLFVKCEFSSFKNYKTQKGASLELSHFSFIFTINITIKECTFTENQAALGGAVFIVGQLNVSILDCKFLANKAIVDKYSWGLGGAIIVDCEKYSKCRVFIFNSSFINNQAELIAGSILSKTEKLEIQDSSFINNTDMMNLSVKGIFKYPLKVFCLGDITNSKTQGVNYIETIKSLISSNISDLLLDNPQEIVSGWEFNTTFVITDSDLNILIVDNYSKAIMEKYLNKGASEPNGDNFNDESQVVIEKGQSMCNMGTFNFFNMKIIAKPNTTQTINVSIALGSDLLFKSTDKMTDKKNENNINLMILIRFRVRPCMRGEVWKVDNTCHRCEKGTFNLLNPMNPNTPRQCQTCLSNSYCRGGDLLTPLPGFWRASNTSTLILECPIKESCVGLNPYNQTEDINILTSGSCLPGHVGNLCFECERGMIRLRPKSLCKDCNDQPFIYIKTFISIIFLMGYVIFQASTFSKLEKKEPQMAVAFKLLLNHFQTVGLITLIDLGWTVDFDVYFTFQNYISFMTEDFFVIDCIIKDFKENPFLLKIIFAIVLPVGMATALFVIWVALFISLARRGGDRASFFYYISEKMRISFLVLVYLLYPEILRKCFSLLNCKEIDDSTSIRVLSFSPSTECWNEKHRLWVLSVSLPGILCWGIAMPLILLIILRMYRNDILLLINKSSIEVKRSSKVAKPSSKESKQCSQESIKISREPMQSSVIIKQSSEGLAVGGSQNSKDLSPLLNSSNKKSSSILKPSQKLRLNFVASLKPHLQSPQEDLIDKESVENTQNKNKQNLNLKVALNIGFLYRGYKKEYYYWEIVLFSRKFLIIFIGIFTEFFPKKIKATIFIVIVTLYLFFQMKCKPFLYDYLNSLEALSLFVCFFTGNIGILLFSDSLKSAGIFFVFLVALINLGFLIYWAHLFVHRVIDIKKIRCCLRYLIKYRIYKEHLGFKNSVKKGK